MNAAARLAAERDRVLAQIADLTRNVDAVVTATVDANIDDEHDPEGATIAFERAQLLALLERAREQLAAVHRAAARVAEGTYEACERCGHAIGADRLEALPTTTTCVRCAQR